MAVALLAAILKPQILRLMQGGEEEWRGEKREREISFKQSSLLDMVSRYAAAMARIKSWQRKLTQNKEAEKGIFFFPSFGSLLFLPPLHLSLLAQHLTQGAVRGQLFPCRSRVLRNADLPAKFTPGPLWGEWGRIFYFSWKKKCLVCAPNPLRNLEVHLQNSLTLPLALTQDFLVLAEESGSSLAVVMCWLFDAWCPLCTLHRQQSMKRHWSARVD